jgi:hypothetical protein
MEEFGTSLRSVKSVVAVLSDDLQSIPGRIQFHYETRERRETLKDRAADGRSAPTFAHFVVGGTVEI